MKDDKFYDAACLACKIWGDEQQYAKYRDEMIAKGIPYYSEAKGEEARIAKYRAGGYLAGSLGWYSNARRRLNFYEKDKWVKLNKLQ